MEVWPDDYLDLIEPAHIAFEGGADGVFVFGAVKGWLDVRYGARDGAACAEFSWEGHNDADPASGRGWATIGTAGRLALAVRMRRVNPPRAHKTSTHRAGQAL